MAVETPSPQDATIWCIQTAEAPMQLGAVCVFDGSAMRDEHGALRVDELRRRLESRLGGIPRLRQRLVQAPLGQGPLLVDDLGFDIARHVRVTALPRPGSEQQLQALTAAMLEATTPPGHPPWELWLVDGLEHDRVALLVRMSHVLADGIAVSRLVLGLLDGDPGEAQDPPVPSRGTSEPGRATLLGAALAGRSRRVAAATASTARVLASPARLGRNASRAVSTLGSVLARAAPLPITTPVGARRAVAWTSLPLSAVAEVRRAERVTVNDVVLAVVGAAMSRYLPRRGVSADHVRVVVPVGAERTASDGDLGNDFSLLLIDVPAGDMDPLDRLREVAARARQTKASPQVHVGPMLFGLGGVVPSWLLRRAGPTLLRRQPFANLVVTNVRGTPEARYLLGGRMLAAYPLVGVTANVAVIIGVVSYEDSLGVAVTADADAVPDVQHLVDLVSEAAAELVAAVRAGAAVPRRPRRQASMLDMSP